MNRALRLRFLSKGEILREGLAPRLFDRGDLESVAREASRSTRHRRSSGWAYFKGRHLAYGAHEMIRPESRYLTILRDPVDWVVSAYHFSKRSGEPEISLEEFVRSGRPTDRFYSAYPDNIMTRMLCGEKGFPDRRPIGTCDRAMLEKAMERAKSMFGGPLVLERLDESLVRLFHEAGWKPFHYITSNVNKRRPPKDELTADQRKQIEEANRLDRELYERANGWLDEAIARRGEDFGTRLEEFREANARFQVRAKRLNRWFTRLRNLQSGYFKSPQG